MKKAIAFLLALIICIALLSGCGNSGGQQSSGNTTPAAGSASQSKAEGVDSVPAASGGDGEAQADEGERIRLEISNEDTEKGYLSAICPADWYDHSNEEKLFFSESATAGDYAKPYIQISYAPTATLTGGDGEDIVFEMGAKNWEGLHNKDYNTYNVTHQLEGGGGLSVVSMGAGPDDAVYEMVVGSIWVEF